METPVNPVNEAEAAPTPPPETAPAPLLTKFRAVIQGGSKRGNNNAIFTTNDLRGLVEVAATFSDKITFFVDADGVKVRVLDSAKIALLDAMLPRSVFVAFDADGVGHVAVDAKSLLVALRRAKSKGAELKYEDGQLVLTIAGVRSFRVRALEASVEAAPQPKVNHTASAIVDADLFKEALVDARVMKADAVKLLAENGVLLFRAVNETKEVEVKLAPAEGEAASTYALDYLMKAAKAFGDGVVEVKFGNNTPLELATAFNEGYVKVFIAPRVE